MSAKTWNKSYLIPRDGTPIRDREILSFMGVLSFHNGARRWMRIN